jgi:hypothetical protein
MQEPEGMHAARDALRDRVARLDERHVTLGALCDAARTTQAEIAEEHLGDDVRLSFRSVARADPRHVAIELVWHWPRPEQLDAPPGRLWLRFDVASSRAAREVEVRCHDYPHVSAFVSAALEAAALDPSATATDVHLECEHTS